jgi:5-methyltetrahydrofolate--homocysteine methyltransferase
MENIFVDPLVQPVSVDKKMMANIIAAEALAGRDNFCMNDLKAFRAGMFEG